MAPMHNPEQGIQEPKLSALPASASAIVPAPPSPAPAKPRIDRAAAFARRLVRIDCFLAFLLLVLAFFVASFAVQNSDFWMHLATGRLLAQGEYQFGQDPFSYSSEGPWINHAWLYDWGLYGLYQLVGGTVLVVIKGLLIVGLALLLFQIRRPGTRWLVPVLILGLAVLALSPRLLLQPSILSYLFLGITLWMLLRQPSPEGSVRRFWWLPALFVLWVNVDSWFILGPLTVAFFLLGTWIGTRRGQRAPYPPRTLAAVLGVGLVACLINPHHVGAFQLPMDLAYPLVELADLLHMPLPDFLVAAGRALQNVRFYEPQTVPAFSPFWGDHIRQVWSPFSLAYSAYYVLLALGLISFVVQTPLVPSAPRFPWARALLWGFFVVLSVRQIRVVPFFAIVSVPVLVLNFQDFWRRGAAASASAAPPGWLLLGRLAAVLAMIAVVALAWPGWLGQELRADARVGSPHASRRVAWQIEPDPAMRRCALALRELHEAGKIHNGFNYSWDLAHYWAWYCPQIKSGFDTRWPLFVRGSAVYGKLRRELRQEADSFLMPGREPVPLEEWSRLARDKNVDFLVFATGNDPLYFRRWMDERHWPFLYTDGRLLVFAWTPEGHGFAGPTINLHRAAFGQIPEHARPPQVGPEPPTKPRGFLRDYAFGLPPKPLALAEMDLLQEYFQLFSQYYVPPYVAAWQWANYHGPAVTTAVAPGSVVQPTTVMLHLLSPIWQRPNQFGMPNARATDMGPPAVPVLMIRRAREGVAQSPLDSRSYLNLHDAVAVLQAQENFWSRLPAEPITVWFPQRSWGPGNIRATLRRVQQLNALKNSLLLEPANPNIQQNLGELYRSMNYLDVIPEHWRTALRDLDKVRPPGNAPKEAHEQFQQRKQFLEKMVSELETILKQRREDFSLHAGQKPTDQVYAAIIEPYKIVDKKTGQEQFPRRHMGLPNLALSILQKVPAEQLHRDDPRLAAFVWHTQMALLLMLGRAKEVRDVLPAQRRWLEAQQQGLAPPDRFQVRQSLELITFWAAGAVGDYPTMDSSLAELEKNLGLEDARAGFAALVWPLFVPPLSPEARINALFAWRMLDNHHGHFIGLSQMAVEFRLLRGIIALERGDNTAAAARFQRLLTDMGGWVPHPDRPIAQRYLNLLQKK